MADQPAPEPWLARHRRAKLSPRLVVYSVPPVGAGVGAHRELALAVDDDIEVLTLRLPGRENRRREPPPATVEEGVRDLAGPVASHAASHQLPFALLGDCLTSVLAYELARAIQLSHAARPAAVVAVNCRAPHHMLGSSRSAATRGELLADLSGRGVISLEIADDPEVRAVFETLVRADLATYQGYLWSGEPLADVAVLGLVGSAQTHDVAFTSWREATTGPTRLVVTDARARPALAIAEALSDLRDLVCTPGSGPAPSPTLRDVVVNIWASFFPHSHGVDSEGFIEVGGDSIAAVRLRNALRRRLGNSPPLEVILGGATLGEIVAWAAASQPATTDA